MASPALALELGRWGLEGPAVYEEIRATADQDSSYWPDAEPGAETFRYFAVINSLHTSEALPLMQAAERAYQVHVAEGGEKSLAAARAFTRARYPFIAAGFRNLAPVLYFDFRGAATKEYVLTEIIVEVVQFSEFRGGGFSDEPTLYDIYLQPEPGIYSHPFENALRFQGSGRAELRFFSENFYEWSGLSPMGAYMLDITFRFRVDGERDILVSTGRFKIDV